MVQKKYFALVLPIALVVVWFLLRKSRPQFGTPTPILASPTSPIFGSTQILAPTAPIPPILPSTPSSPASPPVSTIPTTPTPIPTPTPTPAPTPPTLTPNPPPNTPSPSAWNFARYRATFPQWFKHAVDSPSGVILAVGGLPINIGLVTGSPSEVAREISARYWNLLEPVPPSDLSYQSRQALKNLISDLRKWQDS